MKKLLIVVGLLSLLSLEAQAQAVRRHLVETGAAAYTHTLRWTGGTTVSRLVATGPRDTSETFDLANLKTLSAVFRPYDRVGTDSRTIRCSLDVSLDGVTWINSSLLQAYASGAITTTTPGPTFISFLTSQPAYADSANVHSTAGGLWRDHQKVLRAVRYGRFRIHATQSNATDTIYVQTTVYREHGPVVR